MGLEIVRRVGRRTFQQISAIERSCRKHRGSPSFRRADGARDFSQIHCELRRSVAYLSKRRGFIPEGTRSLRGQLQLFAVSTRTLRRLMRKLSAVLTSLLILASSAVAEIRSIDIKIFGMD